MPGAQDRWDQLAEPSARNQEAALPDLPRTADRPERGSLADFRRRLEQLPPGHPSSPYNDDLTRKPPAARLKDLELPDRAVARDAANGDAGHGTANRPAPDKALGTTALRAEAGGRNGSGGQASPAADPGDPSTSEFAAPTFTAGSWSAAGEDDAAPGPGGLGDEGPGDGNGDDRLSAEPGTNGLPTGNGLGSGRGLGGFGTANGFGTASGLSRDGRHDPDSPDGSSRPGDPIRPDGPLGLDDPLGPGDRPGSDDDRDGPGDGPGRDSPGAADPPRLSDLLAGDRFTAGEDILSGDFGETRGRDVPEADGDDGFGLGDSPGPGQDAGPDDDRGDWSSTSEWSTGWDSGPGLGEAAAQEGNGTRWAQGGPATSTISQAGFASENGAEEPLLGTDGSWAWHGRRLSPQESQIAEEALSRCRVAEGRNVFGTYGHSGLTPAMRRVEAQVERGDLLPGSERYALKPRDSFKRRLADLIARHPDKSPDDLSREVHDAIRYTFIFEPDSYAEATMQVHSRLKGNGFELEARWNGWDSPEYKGVNSRWRDPAHDLVFEVRFHTAASWEVWQRGHHAYLQITDPATTPPERMRLRAAHARMAAAVPAPPGCTAIPDFRKEGM